MTSATAHKSDLATINWRQELTAGIVTGVIGVPLALAPGVLVLSPLGPGFVAEGAAAGLYGAIIGGAIAALFGTSSFVITTPRASTSLVLATLVASLLVTPAFAAKPAWVIAAAALCVFLAGLWQLLIGFFRIARVIKFTPHPVFAGFLNGAALLIVISQLKPFFFEADHAALKMPDRLAMLAFILALALLGIFHGRLSRFLPLPAWFRKMPGVIFAFIFGIAAFYAIKASGLSIDIGPVIGRPDLMLTSPLLSLRDPEIAGPVWSAGWNILLTSLVLAIVATMETLMTLRYAQSMDDIDIHPVRDLAAQGAGNCATALLAPIACALSPGLQSVAFQAGGRTWMTGLVNAAIVLIIGAGFAGAVAAVPNAVLAAVLLCTGAMMVDSWSVRLFMRVLRNASPETRRRDLYDLVVVAVVMGITLMTTVVVGVLAGCLLTAVIFVINMSRPVVRRLYLGDEIFSKRIRSNEEIAILQKAGYRRAVLQLEGVLFFGNAEDLSRMVKDLFEQADMIVLDMRAVTDIDASGSAILGNLLARSRQHGKHLLFCNVAAEQSPQVRGLFDRSDLADAALKPDLETALEWIEEEILRGSLDRHLRPAVLSLEEIDFLAGVPADELAELRRALEPREFSAGDEICHEGDPGDRMWLLMKGSVSVRLTTDDHRGTRRIASLGRGTMVGEMALIEGAPRSASIVADEDIFCYELSSDNFNRLLHDKPAIAAHIMRNTARELANRLRRTSEDLRQAAS